MTFRDYLAKPPTDFISEGHPVRSFLLNALGACEIAILLALFLIRRPKLKPAEDFHVDG